MNESKRKSTTGKITKVLCIGAVLAAIVLMFLNRAGVISIGGIAFLYLLFLLCPLFHILMLSLLAKYIRAGKAAGESDNRQTSQVCHE
jgi:hypothetical protein